MNFRIVLEWNPVIGLKLDDMYPFYEGIQEYFKTKDYGQSVKEVFVILNALGYDVKQRKRFKKDISRFVYDILLDYFLIKNVQKEEKKRIIIRQFVEVTEQVFSKYRFADFDKVTFLQDLKRIVETVEW